MSGSTQEYARSLWRDLVASSVATVAILLALVLLPVLAAPAGAQGGLTLARLSFTPNTQTCTSNGSGTAQALTVATAGVTYVELTQSDPDGCTLTLGETGPPRAGQVLIIANISANSATISDSSGVQELTGGTAITLAQYAAAVFIYRSDRWTQATPGGGGTTDAPVDATYVTQTANGTLTNEQALAALSTGYMKVTTTTGAVTSQVVPIPAADGGTGLTLCADDQVLVSNGTIYQCKTVPDCNVITEKLLYDDATNVFSCQTDQVAAGAGSGDVVGPAAATDECFARFDTTTGKLIQDSVICASNAGLITFPDGVKQTFNPDGTTAGINVGSQAGDPSAPANGDLWYDSTANELTGRINGANVALGAGGGGSAIVSSLCTGRLTTESTVPVSTADRTAQSTIYFTPYNGATCPTYSGAAWVDIALTERSLALSGLTSGKAYDVFLYDNAGTLTLELSAAWTNDTTRADAITTQDGIWVKSGTTTRRLVGTIYTTGTTTTEDSLAKRLVANVYNRTNRPMVNATETANTWDYTTATFRQANTNSANQLEYVVSLNDTMLEATVHAVAFNTAGGAQIASGVGVDSTTVNSAPHRGTGTTNSLYNSSYSFYRGFPGIGRHTLAWLENGGGAGTTRWIGDDGGTLAQSGISGAVTN